MPLLCEQCRVREIVPCSKSTAHRAVARWAQWRGWRSGTILFFLFGSSAILESLLFERTLWFIGVLLLAEYLLFVAWLRRRTPRLRLAALIGLLVCIAVPLLQMLVTTQRERIALVCASMVVAVEEGDVRTIADHTSPSFKWVDRDKAAFIAMVERQLERSQIENAKLRIESIEVDAGHAVVVMRADCTVVSDQYQGPAPTKWRLEFELSGDVWLLTTVEPLPTPAFPFSSLDELLQ